MFVVVVENKARPRKYCSQPCYFLRNARRGKVCARCGKPYRARNHTARSKYCSRACFAAMRSEAWAGDKNPMRRPKNRTKMSLFQKQRIEDDQNPMVWPAARAKVAAALTGQKHGPERRAKNSAQARRRFSDPHNHPRWLGGISREPYAWTFNDELKEEVRRRDGYRCQRCGVPQAECKTALPVHHIDYDKRNSDPVNLIALCVSCNFKVNTNRPHWTAFFQAMMLSRAIAENKHTQP